MFLHTKLENRKEPIRIAFIGCGKFVSMFLAQYNHLNKIQIDTHHFKGNYPDKCSVQAAYLNDRVSSKSIVKKSKKWKLLLNKVKLHAHKKHNFNNKLMKNKKINYIRINIYPDGGISRIRVLGKAE